MNDFSQKKPWKETLYDFLSDPTRPNLRRLLQYEAVEDDDIDFKQELIETTELAKLIIAMANKRGGVVIFGLKELEANLFEPVGISEDIDPTDIEKKLSNYLPKELKNLTSIAPARYSESEYDKLKGKTFISVIVDYNPKYIPFMPLKDGKNISKKAIYIRNNRATEPVKYDDVQDILNRRVETGYSSSSQRKLREHLDELKELYSYVDKSLKGYYKPFSISQSLGLRFDLRSIAGSEYVKGEPNPKYPDEDFEDFVVRMIEVKKTLIENLIGK